MTLILILLLLVDWWQTVQIARHPDKWVEFNPILGTHPREATVHAWFAACIALASVPLWCATPAWTLGLVGLWIGLELLCIVNNWLIGIR